MRDLVRWHRIWNAAVFAGGWSLLVSATALEAAASGDAEELKAGARIERLTVGRTVYEGVVIKSISERTVMFLHRGGMASIKLSALAPEWQERFGYNPEEEWASDEVAAAARRERETKLAAALQARAARAEAPVASKFERVLGEFGEAAIVRTDGVDLRPRFRELDLYAKNQGRRPSCAVFAVVSAVEFLHADRTGTPEKLSEEYLLWATQRTLQRPSADLRTGDDADEGFALNEVVTALRGYGIPLASSMPNTLGGSARSVATPSPAVIVEARARTRGSVHQVPGRDNGTRLNNIIHALNAGLPITISTAWPQFHNMRAALLSSQAPAFSHAVTLVGYRSPSGRWEDTTFIFKNSWGPEWGANGYGFATAAYLERNLQSAVLLEINFSQ